MTNSCRLSARQILVSGTGLHVNVSCSRWRLMNEVSRNKQVGNDSRCRAKGEVDKSGSSVIPKSYRPEGSRLLPFSSSMSMKITSCATLSLHGSRVLGLSPSSFSCCLYFLSLPGLPVMKLSGSSRENSDCVETKRKRRTCNSFMLYFVLRQSTVVLHCLTVHAPQNTSPTLPLPIFRPSFFSWCFFWPEKKFPKCSLENHKPFTT